VDDEGRKNRLFRTYQITALFFNPRGNFMTIGAWILELFSAEVAESALGYLTARPLLTK